MPAPDTERPRRGRGVLLALAGLLVGVALATGLPALAAAVPGLAAAVPGLGGDAGRGSGAELPPLAAAADPQPADRLGEPGEQGPRTRAATPEEAVVGFLEAERAADYARSYAHLSDATRAEYGDPAGWVAQHADVLPVVDDFTVGSATPGDGGAVSPGAGGAVSPGAGDGGAVRVESELRLRPGLDAVVGLTPGRARVTWPVVEEDGGYAVDLAGAELVPVLPDEAAAVEAARAWAQGRAGCPDAGEPVPSEHEGGLRGEVRRADALCGAAGEVTVGAPERLGDVDTRPFLSSYGPEVADWARVVPVGGPVALRAVLAPVGDRWLVVGVLGPRAG